MPVFAYTVKDNKGKSFSGTVEAPTVDQAALMLRNKGWIPTSIEAKESARSLAFWLKRLRGVPFSEKVMFTRQMATLVEAGFPLDQALDLLSRQSKNERMKEIIQGAIRDVEGGASLSSSLSKYPQVFDRIYINLLKAGEASGALDKILLRLADNTEREREFSSSIKTALIYPVIVLLTMAFVFIVMVVFVLPKLTSMYRDLGVDLPLPTRAIIFVSDFIIHWWWLLILFLAAAAAGMVYFKSTTYGKYKLTEWLFRLPIFGNLKKQADLAELSRTLALLESAGIPILQALEIVSQSVGNVLYRDAVIKASKQVERGVSLSVPLRASKIFPPILPQMIAVGEETGKLDEVLLKLSVFFENETQHAVKNLSTALEPAIMIALGIMVGLLIFSIITPIYKLTGYF